MNVSTPRQNCQDEDAAYRGPPPASEYSRPGRWSASVAITPRTLWLAMGLVALSVGLWILVSKGIYVLILLFIAIILAEGLRPLMNLLHRRWRIPEPLAVFVLYLGILLVFCFLGWLLVQPVLNQISALTTSLPQFGSQMGKLFAHIQRWLGNNPQISNLLRMAEGQVGTLVESALPLLLGLPLLFGRLLFSAVVVAVMTFFWLTGVERLRPFFLSLFPAEQQPVVDDVLRDMSHRLGGYVRGVALNMCVIGILSGFGDWLLGVPYAILLGIVAGLTELIPYFGPWISGAVAIVVALALVGPLKAVEVIGFYVVLQEIEGNTLVPIVMMGTVDLNPLVVIVAVLFGSELLGIVGGVLAVPAAAVLQVVIVRVLAPLARHAAGTVSRPGQAPVPDRAGQSP